MNRLALWLAFILIVIAGSVMGFPEGVHRGLFISGSGPGAKALVNDVVDSWLCFLVSDSNWTRLRYADNPTPKRLVSLINSTFGEATDEDVSVLFISSHGAHGTDQAPIDEHGSAALNDLDEYICLRSPIVDDAFGSGPIGQALANIPGAKVIVSTACFSGGLAGGSADFLPVVSDALLLSACTESQMSYADLGDTVFGHPHSCFGGFLVSALLEDSGRSGFAAGDENSDGIVDISEWMDFAVSQVEMITAKWPNPQSPQSFPIGSSLMAREIFTPDLGAFYQHKHCSPAGGNNDAENPFPTALCPVAESIYAKLLDIDRNGALVYGLVTSYDIPDDGSLLTLYLKEGVTFHNGSDLVAEHVVRNMTEDMTLFPNIYRPSLVDAGVIAEATEVDHYTINISLSEGIDPMRFLEGLTNLMGMIAHPDLTLGGENAVGAGPFYLRPYESTDVEILLERFDGYHDELALVQQLVFKVIPEATTQRHMLESGEIEVLLGRGDALATALSESPEVSDIHWGPLGRSGLSMLTRDAEGSCVIDNMCLFVATRSGTEGFFDYPDGMLRLSGVCPPDQEEVLVIGLCDSL